MVDVFDENRGRFAAQREELHGLLGDSGYNAARRTAINAHYTDPAVDKAIWEAVTGLGFTGGKVLEPGCGTGTFIGTSPVRIDATGIELDPTTAGIAAALYPAAAIRAESFADTNLPTDWFDLAIGNVPFADVVLHDPRFNQHRLAMHNHFIVKSLNLVRPGGLVAVLTSRYTMDAQNPAARRDMNALGDLVTAVRLPTGAMRRSAGTDAVVDLLVLRRREPGASPRDRSWEQTLPMELDGPGDQERTTIPVNAWFHTHPDLVLGHPSVQIGMYGVPGLHVDAGLPEIPRLLTTALDGAVEGARAEGLGWVPASPEQTQRAIQAGRVAEPGTFQTGHIRRAEAGGFEHLVEGMWAPLKVSRSNEAELGSLLDLRDQARALLSMEAADLDDTPQLAQARTGLRRSWQTYVDRYGPVGRVSQRPTGRVDEDGEPITARILPQATRLLRTDPYGPLVLGLEHTNERSNTATPGPLLTERLVVPRQPVTGVDTITDAVAVSLDQTGGLNLDYMADLLGLPGNEAVAAELASQDAGYQLPGTEDWTTRETYLSGNVRVKLDQAQAAERENPGVFTRNVEALQKVLPPELGPEEITPRLGAVWIPAGDYTEFLREIGQDRTARVTHVSGADWSVSGDRRSVTATEVWGTERYPLPALLEAVMTQKPVIVIDTITDPGDHTRSVANPTETQAAQDKATALQTRFSEWLWEDPARTDWLVSEYNRRFNSLVLRDYTSAGQALTLPGLAKNFTPREHQRSAVARMLGEHSVGLFHEVGAGKTAEMVIGTMELKRLGLVAKPAVVVPDHMLEQFTREWMQLYPQAQLLAAGSKEADSAHRRELVARAATGSWDAIIMSRGAFKAIPVTPQTEAEYKDRETEIVRKQLEAAGQDPDQDPHTKSTIKRIEKQLAAQEQKTAARLDTPRDPGVCFEDTGIDYLCVDELHDFKNLRTASRIPDANVEGSKRATDLHMKIDWLRATYGPRVVTGATATPIANSISELYVMQRYLAPDMLADAGITTFDEWAATFGEVTTSIEMSVVGQLKPKSRFARFVNVPDLVRMMHTYGDVKTAADLHLPTPAFAPDRDGHQGIETITLPPSPELKAFQERLGERADLISAHGVDPHDDNMLKLSSDGRRAALDVRLVRPDVTPQTSKTETAADLIAAEWQATRDNRYLNPDTGKVHPTPGGLQIVFCDMGTPGEDKPFTVYDELRDQLVARGLPPEKIRYTQQAHSDDQKAALFDACRTGEVAVIIGSTATLGTGVNIQARATQLIDLDAPWRPADLTQRHGRILRQGNQNPQIRIRQIVTEQSFDAYMWQTLERKSRFIDQIMRADLTARDIEDISGSDDTNLFARTKAISSGNPLLLRQAEAEQNLQRWRRAATAHKNSEQRLAWRERTLLDRITTATAILDTLPTMIERSTDTTGEQFRMTIAGHTHDNRATAATNLAYALTPPTRWTGHDFGVVARLGGHDITARWSTAGHYQFTLDSSEHATMTLLDTHAAEAINSTGLVTRLENLIRRLPTRVAEAEKEIAGATATLEQTRALKGKPFAHADELHAAETEYVTVQQLIASRSTQNELDTPPDPNPETLDRPPSPSLPDSSHLSVTLIRPGGPATDATQLFRRIHDQVHGPATAPPARDDTDTYSPNTDSRSREQPGIE